MPVLDGHIVASDSLAENTCLIAAVGNFNLEENSCA